MGALATNGISSPPGIGMSRLLLGGGRTITRCVTVGVTTHMVESWHPWTNPHGAEFTAYTTCCGLSGSNGWLGNADDASFWMLCGKCFKGGPR